jgi:uncharacterized protein YbaP (TraB family)
MLNTATISDLLSVSKFQQSEFKPENGIDSRFLQAAKSKNMPIIEIESIEFQLKMLSDFSDETQEFLLKDFLENSEKSVTDVAQMSEDWKTGNVEALTERLVSDEKEQREKLSAEESAILDEINRKTVDERNVGMISKAVELLAEGKTYFYVVGSLHMIGENGIVKGLQGLGYSVTQIK